MKKLISILLAIGAIATPIYAKSIIKTKSNISYNGKATQVTSIIKNDTTYLGVRELADATGLDVSYESKNQSVLIKNGTNKLEILPKLATYYFNSEDSGTVQGVIEDNRVYVPLRFIFEKFGMAVNYKDNVIYISESSSSPNPKPVFNNISDTLSNQSVTQISNILSPVALAVNELDMNNYNDYYLFQIAFKNNLHREDVSLRTTADRNKDKYIGNWYYEAFPVDKVDKYIYNLLGVTPNIKNSRAPEGSFNFLKSDNYYYFPEWAAGASTSIVGIDIKQMFDLGDNYFALAFNEYLTYQIPGVPSIPTTAIYKDWPTSYKNSRDVEIYQETSQAVFHKTIENGKEKWNLVKYTKGQGLLNDSQLNTYKKSYK